MINCVTSACWNYNGKISSCSGQQRQQDWDLCYIKVWIGCAGRTSTLSNVSSVWSYSFHFPRAKSIFQNHKSSQFFSVVNCSHLYLSLVLLKELWMREKTVCCKCSSLLKRQTPLEPECTRTGLSVAISLVWVKLADYFPEQNWDFFFFFKKELMCLTQCLSRD